MWSWRVCNENGIILTKFHLRLKSLFLSNHRDQPPHTRAGAGELPYLSGVEVHGEILRAVSPAARAVEFVQVLAVDVEKENVRVKRLAVAEAHRRASFPLTVQAVHQVDDVLRAVVWLLLLEFDYLFLCKWASACVRVKKKVGENSKVKVGTWLMKESVLIIHFLR